MTSNFFIFGGFVSRVVPSFTKAGTQVLRVQIKNAYTRNNETKEELVEVSFFGERCAKYSSVKAGTEVIVTGRISGRENEYKGKTYFNISMMGDTLTFIHQNEILEKPVHRTMMEQVKDSENEFDDVPF